jgi:hypothetical protein
LVEPGNDPGRDEYGLPPVDIEIPDDARDLDRDVQAYYRELRARRRHVRVRRLAGPLTRHGMVLPLVAACLALTLLTGSLLTVLSGRQVPLMRNRLSQAPTQGVSASRGRQLPDAQVGVVHGNGRTLRSLAPAVLAWVPTGCAAACGRVLRRLASRAAKAHVPIYFVAYDPTLSDLSPLMNQVGPKYKRHVMNDTSNALRNAYQLMEVTAILAHPGGWVEGGDVVGGLSSLSGIKRFQTRLQVLASASGGGAAGASSPAQQPAPRSS